MSKVLLRPIKALPILLIFIATAIYSLSFAEGTTPSTNPALTTFNQAVTFYASFDGHATADLSKGEGTPTGNAQGLQYGKGLWGQALQGRSKNLIYKSSGNIDLSHSGSLIMWISPGTWKNVAAPNQIGFATIRDHGRTLLLARQGGASNKQALMAIYGPKASDAATRALTKNSSTTNWEDGQWHLLVVNWSGNYVELSVDGNLLKRGNAHAPASAPTDAPGEMNFAAGGITAAPYLMDELILLNRTLSNEEVKKLYQDSK